MVHPIWQAYPKIESDLERVKKMMIAEISVSNPEIKAKIMDYINASGKFARAGLVLMFARLNQKTISQEKLNIAAGIELFHLATLIHDDVIDEADQRRGIQAFHLAESNRIAIYAGDYLLAYAMRFLYQSGLNDFSGIEQKTIELILNGELNQLKNVADPTMTIYRYLRQIKGKTALLFGLATVGGYQTESISRRQLKQAYYAGEEIGMAFQLIDDQLDFFQKQEQTGKPQLQDVMNGIYTAPLIRAIYQKPILKNLILSIENEEDLQQIQDLIEESDADVYVENMVKKYLNKAIKRIQKLDQNDYSSEILSLIQTLMTRDY